jgi:ATP-dependent protease Clp ATPase subunit
MYAIPSRKDVAECVINADVVEGRIEPVIIQKTAV